MGRRSKNKKKNKDSTNNKSSSNKSSNSNSSNNNKRERPPHDDKDEKIIMSGKDSNKRRRYNNKTYYSSTSSKKKQRQQKFWIEDCMETIAPQQNQQPRNQDLSSSSDEKVTTSEVKVKVMDVLITRSDLVDDYRQVPQLLKNESDGRDGSLSNQTVTSTSTTNITNAAFSDDNLDDGDGDGDGDARHDGQQHKDCEATTSGSSRKFEERLKSTDNDSMKKQEDKSSSSNETVPTSCKDTTVPTSCKDTTNSEGNQTVGGSNTSSNDNDVFIAVKRSKSAKRPMNVRSGQYEGVENFKPLPDGDCGDGITNPYPKDEVPDKFWSQRRRLFTLFDDGIQLDKESWYSVTPEAIAAHIAGHLTANHHRQEKNVVVLDLFCGCGGNAIQFALQDAVDVVVCVDKDPSKLEMAASNASIYGVPPTKMVFVHDHASHVLSCYHDRTLIIKESLDDQPYKSNIIDCSKDSAGTTITTTKKKDGTTHGGFRIGGIELLPNCIDCIFLSPPWGGIDYGKVGKRNYTLKCIQLESSNNISHVFESSDNNKNNNNIDTGNNDRSPAATTTATTTDTTTANTSTTKKMVDGDDILLESSRALGRRGPIALFLPKNINGVSLGKSVVKTGYPGPVILEQNVLNGKLKTVTAYIGLH